jgi:YggT family protein
MPRPRAAEDAVYQRRSSGIVGPCRSRSGTVHVARPGPAASARRTRIAITDETREMIEFLGFISTLLTLYVYILIASAVLSWLIAFNVVNTRNQAVSVIGEFLYRITEPVLRPIRRVMPDLGGIDISPVIVILVIFFIQSVILPNLARALV